MQLHYGRRENVKFFEDKYNKDGARIMNSTDSGVPLRGITTVSIDAFVRRNKIKKIDFIKLDIEGAELKLLGAP